MKASIKHCSVFLYTRYIITNIILKLYKLFFKQCVRNITNTSLENAFSSSFITIQLHKNELKRLRSIFIATDEWSLKRDWLWVYSRLQACSGSPTCPRWSLWCERRCHTSSCFPHKGRCSPAAGSLWGGEINHSSINAAQKMIRSICSCTYVHLMGAEKEDGDSLLVPLVRLTDL